MGREKTDVMKPSPLTILMLVAILLGSATLWIVTTLQAHVAAAYEADMLDECRTITGHKKVPCPESE